MDMETTKKNHKKVNLTSSNLSEEKLAELHKILPEAFSENKIDWDKLRAVLGDALDARIEKFSFTWAGKSNAIKNVLIPSKATLRPAKDESVRFDESENLFIEGDNLEVLKLLQKKYFEQVKMIYIDPPYNTGGDFVYRDDFSAPLTSYLKQTGQKDGNGVSLTTNKETSGRYHSDWLSMIYPRLKLAWNLLRDDGVIFVSIDDNEAHNLRQVMNEIFGEENFIASFIWNKKNVVQNDATFVSVNHEYVLCFAKDTNALEFNLTPRTEEQLARYKNPDNDPRGAWTSVALQAKSGSSTYEITFDNGVTWKPVEGTYPRLSKESLMRAYKEGRLWFGENGKNVPRLKKYLSEVQSGVISNTILLADDVGSTQLAKETLKKLLESNVFETPKPVGLIRRFLTLTTSKDSGDIILDFFAGSGATAHAVFLQNQEDEGNRKYILVQLPEPTESTSEAYKAGYKTIADIAKERMHRVVKDNNKKRTDDGFKVFKLSESNYPENAFEFDPNKSEEENKKTFEGYLIKAKQSKLFDDTEVIDVVYENIVKEGLSLNSKISETKLGENNVYIVSDGERRLLVCFDKKIDDKTVNELTGKDYKGKIFICLDNALDDSAKANLGLNVELKTI